jgi:hypothetical protein
MERFHIKQVDPMLYKERIVSFWKEYLPGTPSARLEWMNRENPLGPAIWFFAFDKESDDLAGLISIIPKNVVLNGNTIRCGILGDFIVAKKYRVFGPNLLLLRTVTMNLTNLGFDFIYGIPNQASEGPLKRVGFKNVGVMHSLVKPLKTDYYLQKYTGLSFSKILSPFANSALKALSKESWVSSRGFFEESTVLNGSFNILWDEIKHQQSNMIGEHSQEYLRWRFCQNPLYKFRILTYRNSEDDKLLGFLFFTIYQNKLYIYDIIAKDHAHISQLLKKLFVIGRTENCISINIEIFERNPLLTVLKSFRFFNANKDLKVFSFGKIEPLYGSSYFLCGDRNI